ncbi:exosortase family protein XrtF [Candidatus Ornithobacterium hominis]|uniref:Exosortase family protein XrtF n=1 Tax=Candidatus Ornithobacterium hominis TaxID=2497989 RepID=A0A383U3I2_9FLAO|nr:exosortase family protein XrtF [Candidatus Ornithobacterium hominis]MCT7904620.1 exosortase family protein XrtF [Candidatus Ornithobacterium hominis]SZD73703.1 exosortase family protein XrtF [Candidatus Ornithobacterium hominis]SZD74038.1 exosortase family protein XrtF [Candidatus Ornithobacterium hominis]
MELWKKYKILILLIGKFFFTYLILTLLYSWYLNLYLTDLKIADPFTGWVSDSVGYLMRLVGFDAENHQIEGEAFRRFYLDGFYCSRVNEGCNAISVMIIFVSFVVAFGKKFMPTFLYILLGLVLLHITNLFRISLLNYIFTYHPQYEKFSHDILFPLIIYGMVIILWLIWVRYFLINTKDDEI